MRAVTATDLLRLALLMMSVGTVTLSCALLLAYRGSDRLKHVLPLAVSFMWVSLVVTLRGWELLALEPALWNCLAAYTLGNAGLLVIVMRPWPRNDAKE